MTTSITGNDGVVFTFNDYEIASEHWELTASPDQNGTYNAGPMGAYLYDTEGVTAICVLTGRLVDSTAEGTRTSSGTTTTVSQQLQWLVKQLNGAQLPRAFTTGDNIQLVGRSGALVTPTMMGGRFMWDNVEADPDERKFSIILLVGTNI